MSQDPIDPTVDLDGAAMDFTAQIQQEIDAATAKAFEKQVAGMLGFTISEPPQTVTLTQEMLNKAIEKTQKTGYQLDPLWSITEVKELKPPSPSGEYDLTAYGKVLDEDFLLELAVDFTEKQKAQVVNVMGASIMLNPSVISSNPRRRIEQACPGLEENVQPPCDCYIEFYQDAVLSAVIMHLNDKHAWTREKIADWLDSLDVDLTVNLDDEPTPPQRKPITISPMALKLKENPDWTKEYIASGNMYVSLHTNPELTIAPSSTSIGKAISS
jgi:hypothetical protein